MTEWIMDVSTDNTDTAYRAGTKSNRGSKFGGEGEVQKKRGGRGCQCTFSHLFPVLSFPCFICKRYLRSKGRRPFQENMITASKIWLSVGGESWSFSTLIPAFLQNTKRQQRDLLKKRFKTLALSRSNLEQHIKFNNQLNFTFSFQSNWNIVYLVFILYHMFRCIVILINLKNVHVHKGNDRISAAHQTAMSYFCLNCTQHRLLCYFSLQ